MPPCRIWVDFNANTPLMVPENILDYEMRGEWSGRRHVYQDRDVRGKVRSTSTRHSFALVDDADLFYFTLMGLLESTNVRRTLIQK